MVKEKAAPKTLSAYPLTDQPMGSSLPYVPQARPWQSSALHAPPLGQGRDPSAQLGTGVSKTEIRQEHAAKNVNHPAAGQPEQSSVGMQRPTASVTEIPGASAPAKRLDGVASFKNAGKPIKKGAMQRMQIVDGDRVLQDKDSDAQHIAFPAILWFAVGVICPPFLCCGLRFTSSANAVAKSFGWAAIGLMCLYIAGGLILFAQFYFPSGWGGTDPACLRFIQGSDDFTGNDYGSASPFIGIAGPGLAVTPNISIMETNCSFMAQVVIEADEIGKRDRTLVVRIQTPGTTGDNFGLYVRDRGSKVNPSSDPAPAKAWFEFSRPEMSNPQDSGKRGKCLRGMCDGVVGNAVPAIAGTMYESRVNLGWYKYFVVMAVFANDPLALERPFCMDTCLIENIPSPPGVVPAYTTDPCEGQEMTSCPAAIENKCVLASTREACLGINSRRRIAAGGQVSIRIDRNGEVRVDDDDV